MNCWLLCWKYSAYPALIFCYHAGQVSYIDQLSVSHGSLGFPAALHGGAVNARQSWGNETEVVRGHE
jgi:hypothetical protein